MSSKRPAQKDLILLFAGIAAVLVLAFVFGHPASPASSQPANPRSTGELRLAYFPNLTHAQALVGVAKGEIQKQLGDTTLKTTVFNAGPEAMEALLAGAIDAAYVGPSPAINTFIKSNGEAVRIVAGACSGGAVLVARSDVAIASIKDLDGKRVAVPQLGGTQDVSLRKFLGENGLAPAEKRGTVQILPVKNPDILSLLKQKQIDAAWVPEPWGSRLVYEAGAKVVVDERDLWPNHKFSTTVLVVKKSYMDKDPGAVTKLIAANSAITKWLIANPDEAKKVCNAELKRLTGKALKPEILRDAWSRLNFTTDPNGESVRAFAGAARSAGYLKGDLPDLTNIFAPVDHDSGLAVAR